ncbi:MAG: hypothetical protein WC933_02695 [Candidatus Paceibacterota bacterium]|jgi:hypothetical protein
MTERITKGEPVTMGAVLREAGFSKETSLKPKLVTETKGWKFLLAQIENEPLLERLKELALCDDKRISHEACKTILLDLKGLGAEKTTKIVGLFEKIGNDFNEQTTRENKLLSTRGSEESSGVSE